MYRDVSFMVPCLVVSKATSRVFAIGKVGLRGVSLYILSTATGGRCGGWGFGWERLAMKLNICKAIIDLANGTRKRV